jgi:hypothetical protein
MRARVLFIFEIVNVLLTISGHDSSGTSVLPVSKNDGSNSVTNPTSPDVQKKSERTPDKYSPSPTSSTKTTVTNRDPAWLPSYWSENGYAMFGGDGENRISVRKKRKYDF